MILLPSHANESFPRLGSTSPNLLEIHPPSVVFSIPSLLRLLMTSCSQRPSIGTSATVYSERCSLSHGFVPSQFFPEALDLPWWTCKHTLLQQHLAKQFQHRCLMPYFSKACSIWLWKLGLSKICPGVPHSALRSSFVVCFRSSQRSRPYLSIFVLTPAKLLDGFFAPPLAFDACTVDMAEGRCETVVGRLNSKVY